MIADRQYPPRRPLGAAWLAISARAFTALVGGYLAAAALATLLARLLPGARAEATLWALLLSPLLYVIAGLWAFHEPRLTRVLAIMWGGTLLADGAIALLGMGS
ncbi:iron transporter [Sphingomonas sp. GV3]|jgi:uncharacterized membrane protein HdeD (DUF308 family)|uniref:iron transporter n=1 Tax=Sphingomonas sp. GV3 TaxID=3040671 RepID=UPI00280B3DF5|nr:iron transporter [Sphingomonas sp. GV3]